MYSSRRSSFAPPSKRRCWNLTTIFHSSNTPVFSSYTPSLSLLPSPLSHLSLPPPSGTKQDDEKIQQKKMVSLLHSLNEIDFDRDAAREELRWLRQANINNIISRINNNNNNNNNNTNNNNTNNNNIINNNTTNNNTNHDGATNATSDNRSHDTSATSNTCPPLIPSKNTVDLIIIDDNTPSSAEVSILLNSSKFQKSVVLFILSL